MAFNPTSTLLPPLASLLDLGRNLRSINRPAAFGALFEVLVLPSSNKRGLRMTADNSFRSGLMTRDRSRRRMAHALEYDVTSVVVPATHVLAVEAFNDYAAAGVLLGLRIDFATEILEIPSDASWRLVPTDENGWEKEASERTLAPRHSYCSFWPVALAADFSPPSGSDPPARCRASFLAKTAWFPNYLALGLRHHCGDLPSSHGQTGFQSKGQDNAPSANAPASPAIFTMNWGGTHAMVLLGEVNQSELPAIRNCAIGLINFRKRRGICCGR